MQIKNELDSITSKKINSIFHGIDAELITLENHSRYKSQFLEAMANRLPPLLNQFTQLAELFDSDESTMLSELVYARDGMRAIKVTCFPLMIKRMQLVDQQLALYHDITKQTAEPEDSTPRLEANPELTSPLCDVIVKIHSAIMRTDTKFLTEKPGGHHLHVLASYLETLSGPTLAEQKRLYTWFAQTLTPDVIASFDVQSCLYVYPHPRNLVSLFTSLSQKLAHYEIENHFLLGLNENKGFTCDYMQINVENDCLDINYDRLQARLLICATQLEDLTWKIKDGVSDVSALLAKLNELLQVFCSMNPKQLAEIADKDIQPVDEMPEEYKGLNQHEYTIPDGLLKCQGKPTFWLLCFCMKRLSDILSITSADRQQTRAAVPLTIHLLCKIILKFDFTPAMLGHQFKAHNTHDYYHESSPIWLITSTATRRFSEKLYISYMIDAVYDKLTPELIQSIDIAICSSEESSSEESSIEIEPYTNPEVPRMPILIDLCNYVYQCIRAKQSVPPIIDKLLEAISDDEIKNTSLYDFRSFLLATQNEGFLIMAMRLALAGHTHVLDRILEVYPHDLPKLPKFLYSRQGHDDIFKVCIYYAYLLKLEGYRKDLVDKFIYIFDIDELAPYGILTDPEPLSGDMDEMMTFVNGKGELVEPDLRMYQSALCSFLHQRILSDDDVTPTTVERLHDEHRPMLREYAQAIDLILLKKQSITTLLPKFRLFVHKSAQPNSKMRCLKP